MLLLLLIYFVVVLVFDVVIDVVDPGNLPLTVGRVITRRELFLLLLLTVTA